MKRFYKTVTALPSDGGTAIRLDDRPVKSPGRRELAVPTAALGEAIAAEWRLQGETIDPASMKLTGLANAAIDHVAPAPRTFAESLARYADSDLLCYRADSPADLVARQSHEWDPLLTWARRRYDIDFVIVTGIIHIAQPLATVARLGAAIAALDSFRLAAMSPIVTIGGSLVAALALLEKEIDEDEAFAAAHLDELWQAEKWGDDAEAIAARNHRRADFGAAAEMLRLLD